MEKHQIKGANKESSKDYEGFAGKKPSDWKVDTAGNANSSGNKIRDNLAELKDEFKESS